MEIIAYFFWAVAVSIIFLSGALVGATIILIFKKEK
jgi:hypothetical protein